MGSFTEEKALSSSTDVHMLLQIPNPKKFLKTTFFFCICHEVLNLMNVLFQFSLYGKKKKLKFKSFWSSNIACLSKASEDLC